MGLTDSYAYFLPVHSLYQIVSIKLCHNGFYIHTENCADIAGSNNMYSTVMVFDIVNSVDMVVNLDTAITKVEVLYQYEFYLP